MYTIRCMCKGPHRYLPIKTILVTSKQNSSSSEVKKYLNKHLGFVNSITTGIFMGLGDWIQQEIEYHRKILPKRYDWERMSHMFLTGCLIGPLQHLYYLKLEQVLPGASLRTVFKKILADQLIASPLTYICFFYILGFIERKSLNESTNEFKGKFMYAYLGDCFFWPPIQFINFYFLPWQYRVVYINFATMVFNVYLSFVKYDL